MKRIILTVLTVLVLAVQHAGAMSFERASEEARFLTDKMAYELNLDDYQYQKAYDINFDYFYRLNDASDFYGPYWNTRNSALETLFSALQFRNFCRLDYFYRPVCLSRHTWTFPIYRRYPRNRFFRPAPPRPERPHPGLGFRFDIPGRPQASRPGNDRPHNNRPQSNYRPDFRQDYMKPDRRPGNNRPGKENRPAYRPGSQGNRPGDRNDRPYSNRRPGNASQNYRPSERGNSYRPSERGNNFRPSERGNSYRGNGSPAVKRVVNSNFSERIRRM